jgi:hypothetical protein
MGAVGSEHPSKTAEKQSISAKRGTESGTDRDDFGFAAAIAAIMALPLTDTEKAEAVRRLVGSTAQTKD